MGGPRGGGLPSLGRLADGGTGERVVAGGRREGGEETGGIVVEVRVVDTDDITEVGSAAVVVVGGIASGLLVDRIGGGTGGATVVEVSTAGGVSVERPGSTTGGSVTTGSVVTMGGGATTVVVAGGAVVGGGGGGVVVVGGAAGGIETTGGTVVTTGGATVDVGLSGKSHCRINLLSVRDRPVLRSSPSSTVASSPSSKMVPSLFARLATRRRSAERLDPLRSLASKTTGAVVSLSRIPRAPTGGTPVEMHVEHWVSRTCASGAVQTHVKKPFFLRLSSSHVCVWVSANWHVAVHAVGTSLASRTFLRAACVAVVRRAARAM